MNKAKFKNQVKDRRHKRVRAKVSGTAARPRLSVFRSLSHTYAQLIDDESRKTLASARDKEVSAASGANDTKKSGNAQSKVAVAAALGKLLAEKALSKNIKTAVFDKGPFKYHGRVKAVAEGAREAGLKI